MKLRRLLVEISKGATAHIETVNKTCLEQLRHHQDQATMTEISLDSPKDFQFLKSTVSLATREKLDIHLPPTAVADIHSDILRKRVEEMLDEVTTH